jgi:hypothetical protein
MKRGVLLLVVMTAALLLASGAALAATATYTDEVRGVEISAGRSVDGTRVGPPSSGELVASCRGSCTLR